MKQVFVALSMLMVMSLTACQTASMSINHPQNNIEQTEVVDEMALVDIDTQPDNKTLSLIVLNNNWILISAVDSNKNDISELTSLQDPATLSFSEQSIGFGVGCNRNGGDYQLNENELSIGIMVSTQMYCPNLDSAERKLYQLMSGSSQLTIVDNLLIQTTANGSTLTWKSELKDEVKYGEGETIFLEVAPQIQSCYSGINNQCLKVREVYYDDKSLKSGYGEWRLFDKSIKGYRHDPQYRKLLRIKKYVTDPVDVKGKQLVYVLDMAVETEVVK